MHAMHAAGASAAHRRSLRRRWCTGARAPLAGWHVGRCAGSARSSSACLPLAALEARMEGRLHCIFDHIHHLQRKPPPRFVFAPSGVRVSSARFLDRLRESNREELRRGVLYFGKVTPLVDVAVMKPNWRLKNLDRTALGIANSFLLHTACSHGRKDAGIRGR